MNKDIDEKTLNQLVSLVYKHTGITIAPGRKAMLCGRVNPRLRVLGLSDYEKYIDYLDSSADEVQIFIDLVTTNETYFYRTPRIWSYLENEFIPQWIAENQGKTFNAWSAAASSGEEAHTLGIILQHIKSKQPAFKYQILGTDISGDILKYASKGEYSGRSLEMFRNTRPELFKTYMKKNADESYSDIIDIMKNIKFVRHNLFNSLNYKEKFDLILLRNVLIYFGDKDQEKVLSNIEAEMSSKCLLVIGESESLNRLNTNFNYIMPQMYTSKKNKTELVA